MMQSAAYGVPALFEVIDGTGSVVFLLGGVNQRPERLPRGELDERPEVGRAGIPVVDGRGIAEGRRDLIANTRLSVVDASHRHLGKPAVMRHESVDEDALDLLRHISPVDLATVGECSLESAAGVV